MCGACDALQVDLDNLQVQFQAQLRINGALKKSLAEINPETPTNLAARELFEYWCERCDHQKAKLPLDGKRAKAIRNALRSHEMSELKEAVDGAAKFPYTARFGKRVTAEEAATREDCERKDELEMIVRDEVRIEEFRKLANRGTGRPKVQRLHSIQQTPISKIIQMLGYQGSLARPVIGNTDAWVADCPAHVDYEQSLLIWRSGDGRVWPNCNRGCRVEDILARICLSMRDLSEHAELDTGAGFGEMLSA